MKENAIAEKSEAFAVRIVKLSKCLREEKREYEMAGQLLRSGTSIGANVSEAKYAYSRKEFNAKMQIALKEASETKYWLRILNRSGIVTELEHESISLECAELVRLLVAITKQTKEK